MGTQKYYDYIFNREVIYNAPDNWEIVGHVKRKGTVYFEDGVDDSVEIDPNYFSRDYIVVTENGISLRDRNSTLTPKEGFIEDMYDECLIQWGEDYTIHEEKFIIELAVRGMNKPIIIEKRFDVHKIIDFIRKNIEYFSNIKYGNRQITIQYEGDKKEFDFTITFQPDSIILFNVLHMDGLYTYTIDYNTRIRDIIEPLYAQPGGRKIAGPPARLRYTAVKKVAEYDKIIIYYFDSGELHYYINRDFILVRIADREVSTHHDDYRVFAVFENGYLEVFAL